VRVDAAVKAATSTDIDGKYTILFAPNATYHVSADLVAFGTAERDLTLGAPPCDTAVDFALTLRPRGEALAPPAPAASAGAAATSGAPGQAAPGQPAAEPPAQQAQAAAGQGTPAQAPGGRGAGGRGGAGGQNAQAGRGAQRFETLNVQSDANGAAALDQTPTPDDTDASRLLPAGFSLDSAGASVAISGSGDATSLDNGALNDRFQAIGQGQFDPTTGQFAAGFAPGGGGGFGAPGGGDQQAPGPGGGGRGGPGGPGGRGGGPGGRGGFNVLGRGARGQSPYQGTVTYTFGGALLNAVPFEPPNVPVSQPEYAQNTFGTTLGGPVKIPGIYKDTNRRTNFQLNYTGNRSNNLFDQYATVPTMAERNGDFSSSAIQLVNPATGQPFAGNQIPQSAMDPAALALLGFIPQPNLPGTQNNYHVSTTARSSSDALSLRLTQNLSKTVQQGGRGGRGGFGGGGGRGGGPGGRGTPIRGTSVVLSAQLQYRRNETDSLNVFPNLGSQNSNTSLAAPITLNVSRGRTVNTFTVQFTRTTAQSTNAFSGVDNVAGDAGIQYPPGAATNSLNWGVPNVTFGSGFTGLNGPGATLRTDSRTTASYVWSRPINKHQIRIGADYRFDNTMYQLNSNARGSYTFSGLYSSGGALVSGTSGADFADFLLGAPQQATLQAGTTTHLHGEAFDGYITDNWQKSSKLTFNLGLRYELALPYTSVNGQLVNLDAAPGFTAVTPVEAGGTGPYTGQFPAGLINADKHDLGPRIGLAYRVKPSTTLRGGYSVTFNPGSYATIARQLAAQPPFATTETVVNTPTPLPIEDLLLYNANSITTNNYGVDKNYELGVIQSWNASVTRNLGPIWSVVLGYTGVRGTDVDLLSAPNRGPSGLLIPTVQPFTWESSDAHSIMNSGTLQVIRRLARGLSGSASYTLMKAMDDSPSLGGGGSTVAQDPQTLGAEWALSNYDRRNQFTGNLLWELPFGVNRRWLTNGGFFSSVFGNWSMSLVFTDQSGTPLTVRVVGATSNVAQGTTGALRANYIGGPVQLSSPSVYEFFNTAAFAVPGVDTFGDSTRNMVIGPSTHQLNAVFIRDLRLSSVRALTLQIAATNLLNTAEWATVNTNINSQTFGQVTSFKPSRSLTLNARFRF
jgi:hypothetical protein